MTTDQTTRRIVQAYADTNGVPPSSTAPTTACPEWCTVNDCRGEHYADFGCYIPATGSTSPAQWNSATGYEFPSVGVTLVPDVDDSPMVSLHILGPSQDSDVYLTPQEARRVVRRLQEALKWLSEGCS